MYSVKIVARPDARMVEVPLEFECELPREFEGQAVLASSGVPRKIKLKAPKDAVKISTAYRADVLLADIVRLSLRGTVTDMQRVQEAAQKFVRTVRERRQDGLALTVSSNGRGKIDVSEALQPSSNPPPAAAKPVAPAAGKPPPPPATTPPHGSAPVKARPPSMNQPPPPPPGALVGNGPPARPPRPPSGEHGQAGRPPPPPAGAYTTPPGGVPLAPGAPLLVERLSALERRISQLESIAPQVLEARTNAVSLRSFEALSKRVEAIEAHATAMAQHVDAVHGELRASEAEAATQLGMLTHRLDELAKQGAIKHVDRTGERGPLERAPGGTRRATAVEAFADGLRRELRLRIEAATATAKAAMDRVDHAAALAAEAARSSSAAAEGSEELRALSAQAAARHLGLQRLGNEVEFYEAHDLPVAALLLDRLEKGATPDPTPALRGILAAAAGEAEQLADWIARGAAITGDQPYVPEAGEAVDPERHEVAAGFESRGAVARTVVAGLRRADGTVLRKPRVETSESAAQPEAHAAEPVVELGEAERIDQSGPIAFAAEPEKPAEAAPAAEAKPAEPPPAEAKTAEPPPADAKPAEPPPAEAKPAEPPPAEAKPAEPPPAEAKPAERPPAEVKPAEPPPAETKPPEPPPAEAKPAEQKPAAEAAINAAVHQQDLWGGEAAPAEAWQAIAVHADEPGADPWAAHDTAPDVKRVEAQAATAPKPDEAAPAAPKADAPKPSETEPP